MGTSKTDLSHRGATLFMIVLSTAMIVAVLGLAGIKLVRVERQQISIGNDRRLARLNSHSAVELALAVIANDPNWRATYTNGVETTPQTLGPNATGTLSWVLEDIDGNLTDADTNLKLKGVGRVGNAAQVASVALTFSAALNCLEVAVCSNGSITFWSSSTETTNQTIHSNSDIVKNSGTLVNSDVDAVGTISGSGTITGTATTAVPARDVPLPSVFDYYIANGTPIDFTSLPKISGKRTIQDVVLSPGNNPYGATDPAGIYVVDCVGGTIQIQHARIIATLVLINPGSMSIIKGEVSWEPAVANYPALLIQGGSSLDLEFTGTLDEAIRGVNFNPPGSPYQGSTDIDLTDGYPSLIKGIVYSSVDLIVTGNHPQIEGVLITGDELKVNSGESLSVTYDSLYSSVPPPGFGDPKLSVVPGSWLWDAAP